MKKRILKYFLIFTILSVVIFSKQEQELKKVVILSRHGLRSPLTAPGSRLSKITPYPWEEWDVKASYLTKKGAVLEMKNCKIDREGCYPYSKFISELEKTIESTE